ncbi:hypothetical protein [Gaoshiqia sediminis]|uniref:DUF927 domain-containing protein n=1 Tax=Gaoshiqia sediminis TaxID=2986998 RepID=A0AA41Y4W0_9BACT|nr:hypothetical protein [Gaoshiqia sediminis]MCW0483501.1 hypothetical protein [Gaoshiqia sediminis]
MLPNKQLPQIPDTESQEDHLEIYGFYIYGGKYFTVEIQRRNKVKVELSNFVGSSLFHLVNGTNNSKRIIQIQRNTGETYLIEIQSGEMKLETFETILKSKQCTFYGNTYQLKRIFSHWMDNEVQAHIIETMGWNPEHQVYAFSNAIFTTSGKLLNADEVGVITCPDSGNRYYLPAFGQAHINNPDYEGERKFVFLNSEIDFENWAILYYKAFETNGGIAILFLILSLFWEIVFDKVGFFPFLFLFGAYGTGKTSMTEYLLRVFGGDFIGIPLNNATQVALSRTIASRNNTIFYLKEYTPETDEANQDLILTAYDGSGRVTGVKSNDNRTRIASVKSAIVFDGNHLPNQKTAVLSRMILLHFENNKFSAQQREAFNELHRLQEQGWGRVITDILRHREFFAKNFRKTFDENIRELRESLKADFAERTLKHVALILTPARLLYKKLPFPFSFNDITRAVVENAKEQNILLRQTDEVTIFWQAFAYNIRNGNLVQFIHDLPVSDPKKSHYRLKRDETGESVLQIKLQLVYPEYVRYCKNNNQKFLDSNSLRMLLTSKSYSPFIPNTQKGRGGAYTDSHFGSCYQFRLNLTENEYSINEIELNL